MTHEPSSTDRKSAGQAEPVPKAMTRREFLKVAGATGVAVGLMGGLGALAAACGEEETTSTAPPTSATTATTAQ